MLVLRFFSALSLKLPELPGTRWLQQQPLAFDLHSEAQQGECEESTKGSKAEESSHFPRVL